MSFQSKSEENLSEEEIGTRTIGKEVTLQAGKSTQTSQVGENASLTEELNFKDKLDKDTVRYETGKVGKELNFKSKRDKVTARYETDQVGKVLNFKRRLDKDTVRCKSDEAGKELNFKSMRSHGTIEVMRPEHLPAQATVARTSRTVDRRGTMERSGASKNRACRRRRGESSK